MEKNIYKLLQKQVKSNPRHVYLDSVDNLKFTLEELHNFVLKFNNYLEKKKIKKQEKIFVVFENSPLLTLLFYGIICSQRIFVPINPSTGSEEIKYIYKKIQPKLIILDNQFKSKFSKKLKNKMISIENHNFFTKSIFNENQLLIKSVRNKNVAEILFTSGSTGKPKAIVLTHESMMSNLYGIYKKIKFDHKKNYLAITPVYHNNGQFIPTLIPLLTFGKTTPSDSLTSIANFWSLVKMKNIHYSSVMVTHINYLYFFRKKIRHSLKALFCGGAKLDINIQKKFFKYFKTKILSNYGLTEVSSIASTETFKNFNTGTAGSPLFNNKILIKKKSQNHKFGEIYIKGKNLFKEYYKDKKNTSSKNKNGYFLTGDLGCIDNKGNLFIKDRIDSMFIVSGENIYPNEIENYANNYQGIKNSFVMGINDKLTSKKIIIIYEGRENIEIHKLNKFLAKKISSFKLPKQIFHIKNFNLDEIPKAPNGKILRKKFTEMLSNKNFS